MNLSETAEDIKAAHNDSHVMILVMSQNDTEIVCTDMSANEALLMLNIGVAHFINKIRDLVMPDEDTRH